MTRYLVKFFKSVDGDNGMMTEACQGWFENLSPSEGAAIEEAKRQFCEKEHLSNWSIHADRVQAERADFPS